MYVNARAIIEREMPKGTEILLQVRYRAGEARALELPGGRLEDFEPILEGLAREVREETGLRVTEILGDTGRTLSSGSGAQVECLVPFFVYQTVAGPVDSTGFFFRCRTEGELTSQGDGAIGHRWVSLVDVARRFQESPQQFDWLTQGALQYYLQWRHALTPLIRLAVRSDADELARLRWDFSPNEVAASGESFESFAAAFRTWFAAALDAGDWTVWVAESAGRLVSNMYVHTVNKVPRPGKFGGKWGYLTNVYTEPSYRGRGLGSELLQALVGRARAEGLELLLVWPSEESAAFYERAGFVRTPEAMELPL